ncbi:tripartite tricarboxylate transporter TctB family protein [Rhizobium paknamense]|uniref:Tricarboxylic transport membrane protein n=1 Tax=Rhizobium paknamense TaxID=1206817 RepID=A0ABU0ICP4_9HYPH|nr:tripartite tricarboxylate transporter TctB family protein [Rhizobium paknamense]MDQ0455966.1 putative tricarboxylic transport membrane protein [Rhizobium paknamense]
MSDLPTPSSASRRLVGRISAICLLALAAAYGIGGSMIEYAFASDPLGPRVFPVALAVVLAGLSLFYLKSPGWAEGFPSGTLLLRILSVPALLVVSVLLFEPAGFAVSVFVLTFGTGIIFGAPWLKSLIGAAGHAALWWVVFSLLLEVYLPAGNWFG